MEDELTMGLIADDDSLFTEETGEQLEQKEETNQNTGAEGENPEGVGTQHAAPDNLYSSLANVLREQGVITDIPEGTEIKQVDDVISIIKNEIRSNEYGDLTEYQKQYLEAIRNGVPEDAIMEHQKESIELDKMTDEVIEKEDNENLRRNLITNYFKSKGFDDDESSRLADQQFDTGSDIEVAKKAVTQLKNVEKAKYDKMIADQEARKEADEKMLETYKERVFSGKISENLEIKDNNIKQKIYDSSVKIVAKTEDGIPLTAISKYQYENPVEYQMKLAYLFEMTDGFNDLSKLSTAKKAKTNAIKEMESFLKSNSLSSINGNGNTNTGKEQDNMEEFVGFGV